MLAKGAPWIRVTVTRLNYLINPPYIYRKNSTYVHLSNHTYLSGRYKQEIFWNSSFVSPADISQLAHCFLHFSDRDKPSWWLRQEPAMQSIILMVKWLYLPRDKMVDNTQTIFLDAFSCILFKFSLKFVHKGPIGNYSAFGLDNGLAQNRRQAIIWTNAGPIHWRKCAVLGRDELKHNSINYLKLCHSCTYMKWDSVGLGNDLSPIVRKTITWRMSAMRLSTHLE